MEIGEQVTARVCFLGTCASFFCADFANILAHLLLACLVKLHHSATSEVQGEACGEKREQTDLHGGVVDDLGFSSLVLRVAVLELSSD